MIGKMVTVTIDRPLGSFHPKFSTMQYPVNYGFVEGIMAEDGDWQDAYVLGVDIPLDTFVGEIIAIVIREDDVETKWVVAPQGTVFTREEIEHSIKFQEQYYTSKIVV